MTATPVSKPLDHCRYDIISPEGVSLYFSFLFFFATHIASIEMSPTELFWIKR